MVVNMWEIIKKTKKMDLEFFPSLMEVYIVEIGEMVNNMERASLKTNKEELNKELGLKEFLINTQVFN